MTDTVDVTFKWLAHGAGLNLPRQQSSLAAGRDLCAALDDGEMIEIKPGARCIIPCGFALALPEGYEAQVRPRSGLAAKHGVTVLNAPGTIDADYRGEVKVILINHGHEMFGVQRGDRIAQMVIASVSQVSLVEVTDLDETARGTSGFGSTGLG